MTMYYFLGSLFLLLLLLFKWWRGWTKMTRLPPGTMGWPLLGETLELIAAYKTTNPEPFTEKRQSRFGPVFKTHLLGKPTIYSTDSEVNKFVLQNEGRLFASSYPMSLEKILGKNSLLLTRGHLHKQLYSLTWSFVSSHVLKSHLMAEIEDIVCSTLSTWRNYIGQEQVIYVQDEAKKATFNVSVNQLLSTSVDAEWIEALRKEYLLLVEGFFSLPFNFPGTTYGRALQARSQITKRVTEVVNQRKALGNEGIGEYQDLLAAFLKQKLTDEQIVDMVISLLVAGYETTSMIITLAVKFLTDHSAVLEHLKAELNSIKNNKKSGDKLSWSDFKSMVFTQCVINETLRMGNMVGGVFRKALQDVDIQGFTIPKGWIVFASFRAVHLDEANFTDAHVFNPWRWLGCNASSNLNFKFTPFGGGPRFCPGHELARVQISVFLYYLLTQFR
ncbi:hypothetical protein KP509_07G096400 [Ceratopteris richardii]|uniref:Cytochrome P450 n=1 Tax=Ceratopteris richardii TaxID=49495 RepID=A0A8T2UDE7_CERRI|nr:hypothetical protein KP509_07G096400 [Ceratopteris richardii]KAH7433995.1 hypothetical protein KP509_07G096400 [Ceratopteris richardii]KAH7433996.1 hypothetical protein KP509_07G096400 [Ceratopteris richardii]KAH7433997.1 hypothetical protein KP509_07G096400 [Ceratopteris richardii]KAH7433999.1 hypothetical protein KP509_07G096400 [Ceratopteris richardii]